MLASPLPALLLDRAGRLLWGCLLGARHHPLLPPLLLTDPVAPCFRPRRALVSLQGTAEKGMTRQTGFDIAVASEIMAILAVTTR